MQGFHQKLYYPNVIQNTSKINYLNSYIKKYAMKYIV